MQVDEQDVARLLFWILDRADTGERGATAVEYTLGMTFIALVCIAALLIIGDGIGDAYGNAADGFAR